MLNVLEFRKREPRSAGSAALLPAASNNLDLVALASRITGLQSRARGEVDHAILMLDLAAQHSREIAARLADPTARRNFDEHVAMIEGMLQLAREMAFKL
jgi:hypothetical protein